MALGLGHPQGSPIQCCQRRARSAGQQRNRACDSRSCRRTQEPLRLEVSTWHRSRRDAVHDPRDRQAARDRAGRVPHRRGRGGRPRRDAPAVAVQVARVAGDLPLSAPRSGRVTARTNRARAHGRARIRDNASDRFGRNLIVEPTETRNYSLASSPPFRYDRNVPARPTDGSPPLIVDVTPHRFSYAGDPGGWWFASALHEPRVALNNAGQVVERFDCPFVDRVISVGDILVGLV